MGKQVSMKRIYARIVMMGIACVTLAQWMTLPGCSLLLDPIEGEMIETVNSRFIGCFEGINYFGGLRLSPDEPEAGADDLVTLIVGSGYGLIDGAELTDTVSAESWTLTAKPAEEDVLDQRRAIVSTSFLPVIVGAELVLDAVDDNLLDLRINDITVRMQRVPCSGGG
jgi:hypothetical protein